MAHRNIVRYRVNLTLWTKRITFSQSSWPIIRKRHTVRNFTTLFEKSSRIRSWSGDGFSNPLYWIPQKYLRITRAGYGISKKNTLDIFFLIFKLFKRFSDIWRKVSLTGQFISFRQDNSFLKHWNIKIPGILNRLLLNYKNNITGFFVKLWIYSKRFIEKLKFFPGI